MSPREATFTVQMPQDQVALIVYTRTEFRRVYVYDDKSTAEAAYDAMRASANEELLGVVLPLEQGPHIAPPAG